MLAAGLGGLVLEKETVVVRGWVCGGGDGGKYVEECKSWSTTGRTGNKFMVGIFTFYAVEYKQNSTVVLQDNKV